MRPIIFFCSILAIVLAAPLIPASADKFYDAPEGIEKAKPGDILKMRKVPWAVRSVFFEVKVKNAWQILVRSEDTFGNATAVVTTLLEPYNADNSKLVSYQTAEDSSSKECSPSWAFVDNLDLTTIVGQLEMFLIQTALNEGYWVSSPDYEGIQGAFTAGHQAGKATLDTIRAVLSTSNQTALNSDADTVLWGYSGGTIASGWAAALQPTYAKDLAPVLKGAAMGGWVTNITATAEGVEGTLFAGLVPDAITGLCNEYSSLKQAIQDAYLVPAKAKSFDGAYDMCLAQSIIEFAWNRFFSGDDKYFVQGWDVLATDIVKPIIRQNTLGLGTTGLFPEIPIFVFHGTKDTIVPFKDAQRVYENWCDRGIGSFEFAVSNSTGHITEVIEGSGAAFSWIKKRFEGKEPVKNCTRTVRSTNLLYPGALTSYSELLIAAAKNVFGGEIGPNGENLTVHDNKLMRRDQVPLDWD